MGFAAGCAHQAAAESCKKIVLEGEVSSGLSWQAPIGQGWVFRLLPIQPPKFSGWDLVVDREQPAGYPDALLLATPPFNSINEREVGTSFGLRAQDAIGWNPRTFYFLIDPVAFHEAQEAFLALERNGELDGSGAKDGVVSPDLHRLLQLERRTAVGEMRIEEARLTPGVADPAPFAEGWALAASRTPHEVEPAASGKSSPLGSLNWMRFSVTLWLPGEWRLPAGLHAVAAACGP